jgi:MinD superfamily P-loop ATPase
MGYDIEKPDILNYFDHVKFETSEFHIKIPMIDLMKCRFCGSCIPFCPETVLHFDKSVPRIEVIPERCKACGECIKGCHVHIITGRDQLCGYIIQGRENGNYFTFGKSYDGHDYHLPLICELNSKVQPGATVICDLPPGNSVFVKVALQDTTVAAIAVKPNRGWKRNMDSMTGMLTAMGVPFGIIINKIKNEESFVREVQDFCETEAIPLLGKIPYDVMIEQGKTSIDADYGDDLRAIFASLLTKIQEISV